MITVWAEMERAMGYMFRYRRAGITAVSYCARGNDRPAWRRFPRYWLQNRRPKSGILHDTEGLRRFRERLGDVHNAVKEIDAYNSVAKGTAQPDTFLTEDLSEAFRNALTPLYSLEALS